MTTLAGPPLPSLVAGYRVLGELGRGGMGRVYRARRAGARPSEPDVAIKVARHEREWTRDEAAIVRERFLREADVLIELDHPNILKALEVDEDPHAGVYIVMELLEGRTLAEVLAGGALHPVDALTLAAQAARALHAGHERGILHRDVKPSNLGVARGGSDVQLKLMDFGFAKFVHAAPVSREGHALGTIPYISPEQLRAVAIDGRADLYSLGLVLYEMLSGRRLRRGNNDEMLTAIFQPQPFTVALGDGALDAAVSDLLRRVLAIAPAARPASGLEMAAELERLVELASEIPRVRGDAPFVVNLLGDSDSEPSAAGDDSLGESADAGGEPGPAPASAVVRRSRLRSQPSRGFPVGDLIQDWAGADVGLLFQPIFAIADDGAPQVHGWEVVPRFRGRDAGSRGGAAEPVRERWRSLAASPDGAPSLSAESWLDLNVRIWARAIEALATRPDEEEPRLFLPILPESVVLPRSLLVAAERLQARRGALVFELPASEAAAARELLRLAHTKPVIELSLGGFRPLAADIGRLVDARVSYVRLDRELARAFAGGALARETLRGFLRGCAAEGIAVVVEGFGDGDEPLFRIWRAEGGRYLQGPALSVPTHGEWLLTNGPGVTGLTAWLARATDPAQTLPGTR